MGLLRVLDPLDGSCPWRSCSLRQADASHHPDVAHAAGLRAFASTPYHDILAVAGALRARLRRVGGLIARITFSPIAQTTYYSSIAQAQ
jgi:hypothetical protein